MQTTIYWDAVCGVGEHLWDSRVTWNSTVPDLPDCFQKTVLIWVPCAVLWLLCPLEIYNISNSHTKIVSWTILLFSKLIVCVILLLMDIAKVTIITTFYLANDFQHLDVIASVFKIATLMLAFGLTWKGKKRGVTSSGPLLCFWFFYFVASAVIFALLMIKSKHLVTYHRPTALPIFIIEVLYFLIVAIQFCLSMLSGAGPYEQVHLNKEEKASIISRILFIWYDSLALLGCRRPLEIDDLGKLKFENSCAGIVDKFDIAVEKCSQPYKNDIEIDSEYRTEETEIFQHDAKQKTSSKQKPFLMKSIIIIFGSHIAKVIFFRLVADIVSYANPLVLYWLIRFVSNQEPIWHGYIYSILLAAIVIIGAISDALFAQSGVALKLKIRTAFTSYIYRKALRLSTDAKVQTTVGEIVNLMSVDIRNMVASVDGFAFLVSCPLQVVVGMVELYFFLGPSALVCVAYICVFQVVTLVTSVLLRRAQVIYMGLKDQRIKAMGEVLNGMKALKLFSWEDPFKKQVEHFRHKEMQQLIKIVTMSAITIMVWASSQLTVTEIAETLCKILTRKHEFYYSNMSLAVFACFILSDENNVLDASKAFVTLSILYFMRRPLIIMPSVGTTLVEASVSLKRLNTFSFFDEIKSEDVEPLFNNELAIQITDGTFTWTHDTTPTLCDINLDIPEGSLVAIVGGVGTGKSSLLSAILGDMNRLQGTVAIKDSFAYCAQVSWIQNATIRDNVLFGNGMDSTRYNRVIKACALLTDLEMLSGGDMTEIGEKGINLSGGQKQRVSLARAAYFDASTYLLDDPLSAVDVYVGKHIFDNVIGPKGLLKNKTRVLVTHCLTYLPEADYVVVLKNGSISEVGTYKELINKRGEFYEFINEYANSNNNDSRQGCSSSEEFQGISLSQNGRAETKTANFNEVDSANAKAKGKLVEKEGVEVGKVKMKIYIAYLRAQSWYTIAVVVSLVVTNVIKAEATLWVSDWSNDKPNEDESSSALQQNYRLRIYGIINLFYMIVHAVNILLMTYAGIRAARHFHSLMLTSVFRAQQSFFSTTPTGRILNRFSSDIANIDMPLPITFRVFYGFVGQFAVAAVMIVWKMPWMTLVIIPIFIMFYFIQTFAMYGERQLHRLDSTTMSPIYSQFTESINGSQTIRAYRREKYFFKELMTKIDEHTLCAYMSLIAQRWQIIRLEILGAIFIFSVSAFVAEGRQSYDPGTVGLIISFTVTVTGNLKLLFNSISCVQTSIVSVERAIEYCRLPPEQETRKVKRKNKWMTTGSVEYKGYKAKYRKELDTVLKGITCSIRGAERVGVVGRTGAGKSSLALALFRMMESVEGGIFIDGKDIATLDLHDLRRNLTIIPQDPVLFSGPLRMNLDPFGSFNDEALWEVLEMVHLKQFIITFQSQLHHPLSEGGENLSVGQRQLICLARALLRKPKILILDEATAAVDFETDALIQKTIRREFRDCTVITIAHRINTVMDSSRIMVLDKGCIKEFDTPANLLENSKSIFHRMAKDAGLDKTFSFGDAIRNS